MSSFEYTIEIKYKQTVLTLWFVQKTGRLLSALVARYSLNIEIKCVNTNFNLVSLVQIIKIEIGKVF